MPPVPVSPRFDIKWTMSQLAPASRGCWIPLRRNWSSMVPASFTVPAQGSATSQTFTYDA